MPEITFDQLFDEARKQGHGLYIFMSRRGGATFTMDIRHKKHTSCKWFETKEEAIEYGAEVLGLKSKKIESIEDLI